MPKHEITKVRREPIRRNLRVQLKHHLTPRMLQIVFASDELTSFDSPSPDDHIKIFLPPINEGGGPGMRDFTPVAWDSNAGTLTLEFALHAHGPASDWARHCAIGDTLEIGGPRGSLVVPDDFDWYVLVGDAAALPSFKRRVATLRPNVPVRVVALVADESEQQPLSTAALCETRWLTANGSPESDEATLRAAMQNLNLPTGEGFIWIAAEDNVARNLYTFVTDTLQHPKEGVKASGYWHA